jgi:hypothetical protein
MHGEHNVKKLPRTFNVYLLIICNIKFDSVKCDKEKYRHVTTN